MPIVIHAQNHICDVDVDPSSRRHSVCVCVSVCDLNQAVATGPEKWQSMLTFRNSSKILKSLHLGGRL